MKILDFLDENQLREFNKRITKKQYYDRLFMILIKKIIKNIW